MKKIELARYYDKNSNEVVVTIEDYQNMVKAKDKDKISDFIFERFYSRYVKPFSYEDGKYKREFKNGFSMMANFCLLIETLESFNNGWGDSDRRSRSAFINFFINDANFKELKNKGAEFYIHVRCGILHQGETTGGWKITRNSRKFFDEETNTINAFKFSDRIMKSLKDYKICLEREEWDSELWDNLRRKMRKIISNCATK